MLPCRYNYDALAVGANPRDSSFVLHNAAVMEKISCGLRAYIGITYMIDPAQIRDYHAHVYYDAASRDAAAHVREAIEQSFKVVMGRWHDQPVGPHPQAMYQVKFEPAEFPRLVPWLMLNRSGLDVLIHPNSGDAYADHAINAMWLGHKLRLRLGILRRLTDAAGTQRP